MSPRARVFLLVGIMSGIALGVSVITLSASYSAAFEQQKARLLETAHSQARLVEAIARHEELEARRAQGLYDRDYPFTTTLETIREAHEQFEGFGQTGEFTLGRHEGDQIVFLLSHRHADLDDPQPVAFSSELAEPMRLAVSGLSGTIVGIDYRGKTVLAAHEPVKAFDLGIVAKIDLSEVRAPFIKAGIFATCGAGGLIFLGMIAFLRVGNPIVRRLEESEERYRELVETTDDLVTRVDGVGRFLYVNHTAETVFGMKSEACVGLSAFDFIHPEDRTRTQEWFGRCVRERVSGATIENGQVSRTGEVRQMLWTSNFHFDDSGGVIAVNAIARDITERKRAEKAIQDAHEQLELRVAERTADLTEANRNLQREIAERKRAEEDLRASENRARKRLAELNHLYDTAPVGLCLFDTDLRYVRINRRLAAINGHSIKEHLGRTVEEVLPGIPEQTTLNRRRVLETGQPVLNVEVQGTTPAEPDVPSHWLVSYYPVKSDDGEVQGVGTVVQDVTELKRKEGQILQQTAVLQGINDVFREALTCETEEELGKKCLAVAERLTGSKFGLFLELNSRGLLDTIAISNPGWDACDMAVFDARALTKNMPVRGIGRSTVKEGKSRIVNGPELATHPDRCGTPEGHPPITAFLGVPLKQGDETIGMIGLANKDGGYTVADQDAIEHLTVAFVEVLRNKRAEGRLDHMQAQLAHVARVSTVGEMVAGIAHEVNQPLCSIQNFTQASDNVLKAKNLANLDDLREWNAAIGKAASRAAEIVKRLRGYVVRAESQHSVTSINEIIEEAVQLVAFEAGRHQTTVRMKLPELSPLVRVDRVEIQQVLVNLLQNAYESMDHADAEVREVIIHAQQAGESVEISVADNGPGLSPENDSQIFDAFVATKQDGLGIGLAIATTIIETHGGKLWAASNQNGGATFHFTLPVAREGEIIHGQ